MPNQFTRRNETLVAEETVGTKGCTRCRQVKPLSEFYSDPRQRKGVCGDCKECRSLYVRTRRDRTRDAEFLAKYGISSDQYQELLTSQADRCKICGTTDKGRYDRFAVDHDHHTGQVRGLLCHSCNVGLGHFRDSRELLTSAIRYLSEADNAEQPQPK